MASERSDAPAAEGPEAVSAATRWFVRGFVALFVLCGVLGLELWPLTGFRLFSHVRLEHQTAWQATTVGPDGREHDFRFGTLPAAYRGFGLILHAYGELPAPTRRALCGAVLAEIRREPGSEDVRSLRIYRASWDALPRAGDRPARVRRSLAYVCS